MLKIQRVFGMAPLAIFYIISSVFISECSSSSGDQSGYFLFTPPFGGDRPPQEVAASKRSGIGDSNDIEPISRAGVSPAASLWVGSHKINWSPLPLFQKFVDHHQEKKQQRLAAQARKYDPEDQQIQTVKGSYSIGGSPIKDNFGHHHHKKHLFHNPHHDFSKKFASGGFFSGLGAAFGKTNAPQALPPKFAEARSSIQPDRDYALPPGALSQTQTIGQPTTPLPQIQYSTGGTFLVSHPGTIAELSTPGPSINPIIDRLRQMTEWSNRQSYKPSHQAKKEGKLSALIEKKLLRLQKKFRGEAKPHKHNIEAIILSNDDDDFNTSVPTERSNPPEIIKGKGKKLSLKLKRKSRGRNVNKYQNNNGGGSSEETVITRAIQIPQEDLVALYPTNAAFFPDPLDGQQSTVKNYSLKRKNRKDKKMTVFKNENAVVSKPSPVSFRFGAEDAKVNPYAQ